MYRLILQHIVCKASRDLQSDGNKRSTNIPTHSSYTERNSMIASHHIENGYQTQQNSEHLNKCSSSPFLNKETDGEVYIKTLK